MNPNLEPSFADEVDEQLTAYLDGELSALESSQLEQKLVHHESLRLRLAELRRAYDLLDDLPETPHDQRFTQSTIEHVIQKVKESPGSDDSIGTSSSAFGRSKTLGTDFWRNVWRKYKLPILLTTSVLIGGSAGMLARGLVNQAELRRLNLIANISGLVDVNELDVAKRLSEESVAIRYLKARYSDRITTNVPVRIRELSGWIEQLTPVQQAHLMSEREIVQRMNPESLDKYRQLEDRIEELPNGADVQEVVRLIGLVMDQLANSERRALDGMPVEDRIQHLKGRIYFKAADYYFTQSLSHADQQAITDWSANHLEPAILSSNNRFNERDIKKLINGFFMYMIRNWDEERQASLIAPLMANLSDDGIVLMSGLKPMEQLQILFNNLAPNRQPSSEQMLDSYSRIPPANREDVDLKDPTFSPMVIHERAKRYR
ncbi:hypothetical protein SH467x_002904 [Pirellulaceae bacterium SH467]|jgi:hypothetical protein